MQVKNQNLIAINQSNNSCAVEIAELCFVIG
jgi:hypothetical protein